MKTHFLKEIREEMSSSSLKLATAETELTQLSHLAELEFAQRCQSEQSEIKLAEINTRREMEMRMASEKYCEMSQQLEQEEHRVGKMKQSMAEYAQTTQQHARIALDSSVNQLNKTKTGTVSQALTFFLLFFRLRGLFTCVSTVFPDNVNNI